MHNFKNFWTDEPILFRKEFKRAYYCGEFSAFDPDSLAAFAAHTTHHALISLLSGKNFDSVTPNPIKSDTHIDYNFASHIPLGDSSIISISGNDSSADQDVSY